MKFETSSLNNFGGVLQMALPPEQAAACERLIAAQSSGKTLQVEIAVKRKKRSLTANAALWAMLQDLAVVLKSTAEELYIESLRKYGFYDDLAVIPEAAARLYGAYRVVEPTGDVVYGNAGRMDVYRCWRGSSQYNSAEFSHLLDMVIQEAKEQGIDFLSEADKALLMEDYDGSGLGGNPPEDNRK